LSFLIIGIGGLACILAGYLAQILGTKRIAFIILLLSCCCCLISPLMFMTESESLFIGFLFLWGMVVIADSPLFSTLVAQNAAAEIKGTALTIVTCIGFSITIISIQLLNVLQATMNPIYIYTTLALGPIIGLIVLSEKNK
jgi:MFS family permease